MEIVNQALETYLRCLQMATLMFGLSGYNTLGRLMLHTYTTATRSLTNLSPFQALYGRTSLSLVRGSQERKIVHSLAEMLSVRDSFIDKLRLTLQKAQRRMKSIADSKRRNVSYAIGDDVYIKLQPYHQESLAKRFCKKKNSILLALSNSGKDW